MAELQNNLNTIRIALFLCLASIVRGAALDMSGLPYPTYPLQALASRAQGTVKLLVTFQATGTVKSARIVSSSGSKILDAATMKFILAHWKASPKLLDDMMRQNGQLAVEIPIVYSLDAASPSKPSAVSAAVNELTQYVQRANNEIENHWNQLLILRTHTSVVHLRITIYSDGHAVGKALDPQSASPSIQLSTQVALAALQDTAPFPAFSDEMKREVAQFEHDDGASISEDMEFDVPSRYGP